MDLRPLALVLLLLAAPCAQAEDDPAEIARLKAEMDLLARATPAVERGAAWLRGRQEPDGSLGDAGSRVLPKEVRDALPPGSIVQGDLHRYGKTALATLALIHAGLAADDPTLVRALAWLRSHYREVMTRGFTSLGATYSMGLFLTVLHDYYHLPDAPVDPQANPRTNPCALAAHDLSIVRVVGRWFLETRIEGGLFSYPYPVPTRGPRRQGRAVEDALSMADMSNTQYALLGLWAAARCGFRAAAEDMQSIAGALLDGQSPRGERVQRSHDPRPGERTRSTSTVRDQARGFSYRPTSRQAEAPYLTGAMTAGGLSSLLISKAILREQGALDGKLEARLDQGIWDAIAWLTAHYRVDANPSGVDVSQLPKKEGRLLERGMRGMQAGWHSYYLYGLERAMVIAGKRYVGPHDWWMDGAELLLDAQAKDGTWGLAKDPPFGVGNSPLVETCFAILFLRRATLRPRAPLLEVQGPVEER